MDDTSTQILGRNDENRREGLGGKEEHKIVDSNGERGCAIDKADISTVIETH